MEYHGKLYGKIGNRHFDTGKTSDDFDQLEKQRNDLLESLIKLTANAGLQKYVSDNKNTLLSESFNKAKQAIEKALK